MNSRIGETLLRARRYGAFALRLAIRWSLRIALPVVFANALLRAFPYKGTAAGIPFQVRGTLFTRPGLSADTSVGNWEFPHVDGLPIGLHISPTDVDLLRLSKAANPDSTAFVDALKADLNSEIPFIGLWLAGLLLAGVVVGLLAAAMVNMAQRYLRRLPRRDNELRIRVHQAATAGIVVLLVSGYGVLSYDRDWTKQSKLTGTLGAVQLFPSQLSDFYNQQNKAYDVLGAVVGIQASLQQRIDAAKTPDTAYNIMFISDMHLAATYPLVAQYVDNFDVKLIVNTGDESEFGTSGELTPGFRSAIKAVAAKAPMLWMAGNHDSPDVQRVMSQIPNVFVLGDKLRQNDGSYVVSGSRIHAFGLNIAAVPDPRVYGAVGSYGSGEDKVTNPLEIAAMDQAVNGIPDDLNLDIMASHEPSAVNELKAKLPGRIRQLDSGHTHAQNATGDLQSGGIINLVEGSTGAGGLDNINRGEKAPPVEFSIESVASNCQFAKLLRFQLADPSLPTDPTALTVGDNVTVSSVYLSPQKITAGRTCSTVDGLSPVRRLTAPIASDELAPP
ncbi:metallophosphoesterase [Jatrophihabitans telluris]|uniref:Metallophosphoesterase n=1 Tax=Jatrophihabitans telluris TaxID=2038343 RepID=A0ABY4R3A8_9ACTN|nr:metallophosphoesterase [Jatrophihabitans telluris]UQX89893.1 metallophosphoesterase [Jatrophihabitans telluris]